ncbi:MAG: trypsin-like peptidase domain-containing protein [Candidatus Acidiferrales bacterium]
MITPGTRACVTPPRAILGALLCLMLGVPLAAQTQAPNANTRTDLLSQFSDSLDALALRVSPAVVQIQVTGFQAVSEGNANDTAVVARSRVLGSGVIVDPNGYIITNAHVVKGAQRVRVFLTAAPAGSQVSASLSLTDRMPAMDAKIIGIEPTLDLALLKIDATGLPALSFADYSALKKGQIVLAFGNPEGFENSVTMGVVSAVARQVFPDVPSVYIQTDAPINPGNSGGPLVDTDGKIVGINTLIVSESGGSQGLGFAIPSFVVEFVYGQLKQFGHVHNIVIGVDLQQISSDLAQGLKLNQQEGVIVSDVDPNGPAGKAGLQIGDILESLDGRSLGSVPLAKMIIATQPSDAVLTAVVVRGAQKLTLQIPVKEDRSDVDQIADLSDPSKSLVTRLGIFGVEIDSKLAADLPNLRIPSGVIVAALAANMLEVETDLQQGDVIHALNGKPILTLTDLRSGLRALPSGTPTVLQIERGGVLMYVAFEMD